MFFLGNLEREGPFGYEYPSGITIYLDFCRSAQIKFLLKQILVLSYQLSGLSIKICMINGKAYRTQMNANLDRC